MADLEPRAKALLNQARSSFEPNAAELAQLRSRLNLPEPPTPTPDPSAEPDPGSTASPANGVAWKVVVALVVVAGVAGGIASTVEPRAAGTEVARAEPQPAERETVDRKLEASPAAPSVIEPAPDEDDPPALEDQERTRTKSGRTRRRPPTMDSLEAELALIGAARLALRDGKHPAAVARAKEYLERFPRGTFVEEADVLLLVAQCAEDPSEANVSRARAYVGRSGARFADRVRRVCLPPEP